MTNYGNLNYSFESQPYSSVNSREFVIDNIGNKDTRFAFSTNETILENGYLYLVGGAATGGWGNDTYYFNSNYNFGIVYDGSESNEDTLYINDYLQNVVDLFTIENRHIVITTVFGGTVLILNGFDTNGLIENVQFYNININDLTETSTRQFVQTYQTYGDMTWEQAENLGLISPTAGTIFNNLNELKFFVNSLSPVSLPSEEAYNYLASNSDLINAFGSDTNSASKHYFLHGISEGRSKSSFDAWEYLASNPDLISAFGANTYLATKHFVEHGFAEGRVTSSFDVSQYFSNYPDLVNALNNNSSLAIEHYVKHGFSEGRHDRSIVNTTISDDLSSNSWTQIGADIDGKNSLEYSGASVSLSADGSIIAVGAYNLGVGGHVRVYQKINETWKQVGSDIYGESAYDETGFSISLSKDGSIVAIGAPRSNTSDGKVRIFQNVNNTWSQVGSDIVGEWDYLGGSISLSADGSTIATDARGHSSNGYQFNGCTRVYRNLNGVWTKVGSDIVGEGDYQAFTFTSNNRISISENGSIIAIGDSHNNINGTNSGRVRVFKEHENGWIQIGNDIAGEDWNDFSGKSVSLSADGSVVAIGANYNNGSDNRTYDTSVFSGLNNTNNGHVRIYKNINNSWTQVGSDIDGETAYDYSGVSVSLSADGSIVAIGANGNDGNGSESGHVRIYKNINNTWTQVGSDIDGEAAGDGSGESISLSADGSIVAIGARNNNAGIGRAGHVRVYKLNTIDTVSPSNLTDLEAYNYIASNHDLISAFGIDIQAAKSHYTNHGKSEGRSLNTFSASDYLAKYSDLSAAFGNNETLALKHYIQNGYEEGRTDSSTGSGSGTLSPTPLSDFEALNYIASYSDLISVFGTNTSAASSHYVNNGYSEGRTKDNFDEWGYLASNNDLMGAFGSNTTEAIKHYISYGKSEGRSTNIFNADSYLNNYADLTNAFGNDHTLAKKHYVEHGFNEGRVF